MQISQTVTNIFTKVTKSIPSVRTLKEMALAQARELTNATQTPAQLAKSFAIGTTIGFLPLPFVGPFLGAYLSTQFKQLNRAAIFAAMALWNDFVVLPLYAPGYKLGLFLFQAILASFKSSLTLSIGTTTTLSVLFGNTIIATFLTVFSYFAVLLALVLRQTEIDG